MYRKFNCRVSWKELEMLAKQSWHSNWVNLKISCRTRQRPNWSGVLRTKQLIYAFVIKKVHEIEKKKCIVVINLIIKQVCRKTFLSSAHQEASSVMLVKFRICMSSEISCLLKWQTLLSLPELKLLKMKWAAFIIH